MMATEWVQNKKTKVERIPEKYQQHAHIFNKVAAQRFLQDQVKNYKIKLIKNALPTLDCHV